MIKFRLDTVIIPLPDEFEQVINFPDIGPLNNNLKPIAMNLSIITPAFLLVLLLVSGVAPGQTLKPDIKALHKNGKLNTSNRTATLKDDGIYLDEKDGDGFAWIDKIEFGNGSLEFDVKGRDVRGRSFVGIAFHATDTGTFDAIYLRPFNFRSPERKDHSVQYISHPDFGWEKLRTEFPGKYEKEIIPAPLATDWVHVRVDVMGKKVSVYINGSATPSLEVEKLSAQTSGKIALWVGNGSDGEFANLTVTKAK